MLNVLDPLHEATSAIISLLVKFGAPVVALENSFLRFLSMSNVNLINLQTLIDEGIDINCHDKVGLKLDVVLILNRTATAFILQ